MEQGSRKIIQIRGGGGLGIYDLYIKLLMEFSWLLFAEFRGSKQVAGEGSGDDQTEQNATLLISEVVQDRLKITAVEAPVTPENERRTRNGKFTLRQLRQTDGIVPLQSGTNQFDSQKVSLFQLSSYSISLRQIRQTLRRYTVSGFTVGGEEGPVLE